VGYVENIQGGPRIRALSEILTKTSITQYIKWAISERGVLGETLFTGFSRVHAALKKHSRYFDGADWIPVEPIS
jgi:hypothetical protein